jgi:hypothetical protein
MFSGPIFCTSINFSQTPRCTCFAGRINGAATRSVAHPNSSGALGNPGKRNEVVAEHTYFITKNMKVDLQQQNPQWVLPILYVFLVRADKSITNVTFGSLNSNGTFRRVRAGKKGGSTPECESVIPTINRAIHKPLYYFTTDISDGGIKSAPGFLKFCQRTRERFEFSEVFFVSDVRAGLRDHPQLQPRP